jgi:hypothetical protein
MLIGAAEALLLAGVVAIAYVALRPLRRWLEARVARLLRSRQPAREPGRVVVLERRRDGSFGREDRHG